MRLKPVMLLAYESSGLIVATLDYFVMPDEQGRLRPVDFEAVEDAGNIKAMWNVHAAVGAGTWPEWIGSRAHEFRVQRDARLQRPIRRLEHVESGVLRVRTQIESVPAHARGEPDAPLRLEADGRTLQP